VAPHSRRYAPRTVSCDRDKIDSRATKKRAGIESGPFRKAKSNSV
jgi:hypothetical protein